MFIYGPYEYCGSFSLLIWWGSYPGEGILSQSDYFLHPFLLGQVEGFNSFWARLFHGPRIKGSVNFAFKVLGSFEDCFIEFTEIRRIKMVMAKSLERQLAKAADIE
jgi:hypothetical protein